ncbi:Rho termination factor N-terminal domain-containing protein, partial [Streptomyces sp. Wh19]|uniref:Rho termination factor N-terminal domain-containing protein n=1 Tax=Streptomyces sp. Wh19 TaxID=3076629 RepID=UPI0029588E9F
MSDTTDLMGVTADKSVDSAAPAEGAATGTTARRRRSGTGLDGMVLAELQQVASGLGIKGTARMRKGQLIEVIKEAQAGSSAAPKAAAPAATSETKPKRRATSKARTGDEAAADAPAEKASAQQQIDIGRGAVQQRLQRIAGQQLAVHHDLEGVPAGQRGAAGRHLGLRGQQRGRLHRGQRPRR